MVHKDPIRRVAFQKEYQADRNRAIAFYRMLIRTAHDPGNLDEVRRFNELIQMELRDRRRNGLDLPEWPYQAEARIRRRHR